MVDTAFLLASLGRPRDALELIEPIRGVFPPLRELVAVDPGFAPVRRDADTRMELARWLEERRKETG